MSTLRRLKKATAFDPIATTSTSTPFGLPLADLGEDLAEQVGIEPAAQAAVGRDHHVADALDLGALHQERMLDLGVGARDVADHPAHHLGVGPRSPHQLLRLADLAGRDHFQRARHLARVLDALDLGFDFSAAGHRFVLLLRVAPVGALPCLLPACRYHEPVLRNSSTPFLNWASNSSFQSPLATILLISSP
jgi:hypothetical protein